MTTLALLLVLGAGPDQWVVDRLTQVEVSLRAKTRENLTPSAQEWRARLIDELHRYRERGEFPHNHVVAGRRPVFIDEHGTHCAVGFLISASGHDALSRKIAAEQNLAYAKDIVHPGLPKWAEAHGFTLEELAAIQPSYAYYPKSACDPAGTFQREHETYLLTCGGKFFRLSDSAEPVSHDLSFHACDTQVHASCSYANRFVFLVDKMLGGREWIVHDFAKNETTRHDTADAAIDCDVPYLGTRSVGSFQQPAESPDKSRTLGMLETALKHSTGPTISYAPRPFFTVRVGDSESYLGVSEVPACTPQLQSRAATLVKSYPRSFMFLGASTGGLSVFGLLLVRRRRRA